jgi:collagenase-like PrtC family protease
MKLAVATNWDEVWLDECLANPLVEEVFGVMQKTPVGSGRPYFIIAQPTEEDVTCAVERVHAAGRRFNYLLNGPCMNNMEFHKATHKELIRHIDWLGDIGVDSVTVSIPYLVDIVKHRLPSMEVRISVIANVNSPQRAKFFENLGADSLTLDYNINRDFQLLAKIRRAVDCQLVLIANDPCLYQCPFRQYHYNLLAHSTQPFNPLEGFYVDYCIVRCTMEKYSNPVEIIRSRWIRPEDAALYEEVGIDTFKLSGRRMSTRWLSNVTAAYSGGSYRGNLFDLLNCVTPGIDPDVQSPQYQRFLQQSEFLEREKLVRLGQMFPVKPYIDNEALDGFIDFFMHKNCVADCDECDYCREVAQKTIQLDREEADAYIAALQGLLGDLASSRLFDDPSAGDRTITWRNGARGILEEMIRKIPEAFRDVARKTVEASAVALAEERGGGSIDEEDVVRAFIRETPAAFREDMMRALPTRWRGMDS